MILRPLLHYQRSFKYSTGLIVSFGAWQNSELAGRTGDFVSSIKIYFLRNFVLKARYYPAYYIMVDWPD